MCLNDAFEVPRKIRNRTLGWMLGSRKWLTVTWSGLQHIWYRIFQNMQFKYGGVFLRRKITISSIIQVSYVAIFLGYLKLVWCLLLDFLGSLIYATGPCCTKKSHFPTGPTQLVQVLYIIELPAKMGIYIVMFAYWRVKVGTWTPVLRYISWMSVLIGESSFSGVKVSVVIFCANLPTFVEYPKKHQILYGYFILADVSSSFFSIKLLQILNIFLNRWNPWINPPKTTNLASIHLKSSRLWDISRLHQHRRGEATARRKPCSRTASSTCATAPVRRPRRWRRSSWCPAAERCERCVRNSRERWANHGDIYIWTDVWAKILWNMWKKRRKMDNNRCVWYFVLLFSDGW